MILANQGTEVAEASLVEQITLEEGGVDPDQLAGLARRYGLNAEARQLDFESIAGLVHDEYFPIVLLDRTFLDREFAIHAVIPFRISRQFVIVLDPLRGERRISRKKFIQAHRRVDRWTVVWQP
jgi:ABC-type bacteriocin/lantibiotic exporter with double-glycine peptidase domain